MNRRRTFSLATSALAGLASLPVQAGNDAACCTSGVRINEIRVTHGGPQINEYFELRGPAGTSLDCMYYIVLGPGGVIEELIGLGGHAIDGTGLFLAAQASFDPTPFPGAPAPDLVTALNFIDGGNRTHLLCCSCAGLAGIDEGSDLDQDNDGDLDVAPWSCVVDCIALVQDPAGPPVYCGVSRGPTPSGAAPPHVYRCRIPPTLFAPWRIGTLPLPPGGSDTPDTANPVCPPSASFAGLPHEPMGAADLVGGGGSLTVTNIGASGQDGVAVLLGSADFACVSFAPPTALRSEACTADAMLSLEWFDTLDNTAATLSLHCGEDGTDVVARFAGQSTFNVQVFAGDIVVASVDNVDTSQPGALFVKLNETVILTGDPHRRVPGPLGPLGPLGPFGLTLEGSEEFETSVGGMSGVAGAIMGDRIVLTPSVPAVIASLSRMEVLGRSLGSLILVGEGLGAHGVAHEIVGTAIMQGIELDIDNGVLIDKTGTQPGAQFGVEFGIDHGGGGAGTVIGAEVRPGFLEDAAQGSGLGASISLLVLSAALTPLGDVQVERGVDPGHIHVMADFSELTQLQTGNIVIQYFDDVLFLLGENPVPGSVIDMQQLAVPFDAWLFRIVLEDNPPFGDAISVRLDSLKPFASPYGLASSIAFKVPVVDLNPMNQSAMLQIQMLGEGNLEQFAIMDQSLVLSPSLPADLNGDGVVDGADLGTILGNWGPCDQGCPPCVGDVNGDCAVDGGDLGELLGSWS